MRIDDAIHHLMPDAKFVLRGGTYEGLEWLDERPKPTLEEIQAVNIEEIELQQWRQTAKVELYKVKIVLDQMGDLDFFEELIPTQSKPVQIAWNSDPIVLRLSPTAMLLAQVKQYTDEQVDEIFKQAKAISL